MAGISAVREAFPEIRVTIHADEADWLADPTKNLSSALGEDPITTDPPDETLEDAQTLQLGDDTWRIIHTPGHSPGGVVLHCEDLGVAFVGDTLFAGSIGRYDFPSSDGPTLFASIREKVYALPDDTVALPGHGPATTIGREKRSNPFVRPE
jgi:glyoxylase-like metal-dependent hydrolase (beta-lactamase superfamily II)